MKEHFLQNLSSRIFGYSDLSLCLRCGGPALSSFKHNTVLCHVCSSGFLLKECTVKDREKSVKLVLSRYVCRPGMHLLYVR